MFILVRIVVSGKTLSNSNENLGEWSVTFNVVSYTLSAEQCSCKWVTSQCNLGEPSAKIFLISNTTQPRATPKRVHNPITLAPI